MDYGLILSLVMFAETATGSSNINFANLPPGLPAPFGDNVAGNPVAFYDFPSGYPTPPPAFKAPNATMPGTNVCWPLVDCSAGADKEITAGQSTLLDGSASGGMPPLHYAWTPATGLDNPAIATPMASPTTTTEYTLTVTDSLNPESAGIVNQDTDTVTVTVYPELVADAGPNKAIQPGESTTLDGAASGGKAPLTYLWTPATGLDDATLLQPTASPAATTDYTLTVTDALSASDSDSMTLYVVSGVLADAGPDKTRTVGDEGVKLEGSAIGGAEPYTYSWSPATGLSDPNIAQPTATPDVPTTYELTVTDAGMQTDTDTMVVHVLGATPLFSDVPADDPARGVIEAMYNAGITAGCGGGNFCPTGTVTRGQMAVFVTRAAGVAPINPGTATFGDVPRGSDGIVTGPIDPATMTDADGTHQFYQYIEAMANPASWTLPATAPTTGCDPGPPRLYCPQQNCLRQQMAVFLCRATGKTLLNPVTPTFNDVAPGSQFYQEIETLADPGSWTVPPTTGCQLTPTRLFCPTANVLRSQMAWFIIRAFDIPW
jgi:hypothetical protein